MRYTRAALAFALAACSSAPHFVAYLDREVVACVTTERAPEDDVCGPDHCLWVEVEECPEGHRAECESSFGEVLLYHNAWFYWLCQS
jgi:hypothetical protein